MKTQFDVIVIGGGVAGIAAALSAARAGANTALIEKEYAPGGLATLGLIVEYLPLCDGDGYLMSGSITEELARSSIKYGPGEIPAPWRDSSETKDESVIADRKAHRFHVRYEAAPFIIAAEELMLNAGVQIYYDARLSSAELSGSAITAVIVDGKRGGVRLTAKAFVDASGDADLCYFAGEKTVDFTDNSRTGWYFSYNKPTNGRDAGQMKLMVHSDPYLPTKPGCPSYNGLDLDDISRHMTDMRKFILDDVKKHREQGEKDMFPMIIPSYHGLRMTRRLDTSLRFSYAHNHIWLDDAVGMIGDWRRAGGRFCIPYRSIKAEAIRNLYAAGRCVSADVSGWDLTRVIPTCSITGEAAGLAAAMQSKADAAPDAQLLQKALIARGALIKREMFE